jgi:hypothetical protein
MRLYRGLKEPYDPSRVIRGEIIHGTDFTDCPYEALLYASGRKGVVLVLEVPEGSLRISEEFWPNAKARRLMVWGRFDNCIVATFPAKELRAPVRRKGIVAASHEEKSWVLRRYIEERMRVA